MTSLLLESAVRATLLIAAVAAVLWAARMKTASVRHAAWVSVVIAMLLLPAVIAWGPQVSLAILPEQAPSFGSAPMIEESGEIASLLTTGTLATAIVSDGTSWSWQEFAFGVYLLGLALFLTRLAVGTFQVHRLVRSAEWVQDRLVHRACSTPITVGCFRPTVLLPRDLTEWPQEQLDAVLAHEAEHVRRRDPLFQWLALLNRAVFWFHPLAWWLESKVSRLAEEACDAAVLAQGHDAEGYSRHLLAMARIAHVSGARLLGMPMPGGDLALRIRRILEHRHMRPASRPRMACVAVGCATLCTFLATGTVGHAQSPRLQFEVATIKLNVSGSPMGSGPSARNGRFMAQNMPLKRLLSRAYGVADFQFSGPSWIETTKFDIAANVPEGTTPEQVWLMLRTLLEDRLKVATHRQTEQRNVFALVVGKGGPKFRELRDGEEFKPKFPYGARFDLLSGTLVRWGEVLSPLVERPVLDKTGLAGTYQHMLAWDGGKSGTEAPDIFQAVQEQLGLKLEPQKGSVEMVVLDRADRVPSEN